jgi:hypothetical protein
MVPKVCMEYIIFMMPEASNMNSPVSQSADGV